MLIELVSLKKLYFEEKERVAKKVDKNSKLIVME